MNNYKKVINDFLNLFQLGILTAKDIKQEISNIIQFKKEKIMNHFNNYTQEDLKELKKKINKLNLEIENLKKQLIIIKSLQSDNSKVSPGSIILTSTNNYFISISSEIYSSDTSKFYCVSINTPIAKAYLGKMIGDIVTFNNIDSKIEKII